MSEQTTDAGMPGGRQPKMSEMSRIVGVFFSPTQTFQDIARKPTWFLPFVVIILVGAMSQYIINTRMDWETVVLDEQEMVSERFGIEMTEEDIDRSIAQRERVGPLFSAIGTVVFTPIILLLVTLIYFAVIKIGKGGITWAGALAVVCFASLPNVLKGVLATGVAFFKQDLTQLSAQLLVPSNVLFFMPNKEDLPMSRQIITASIDAFVIWAMVLTVIGLASASSWSRGKCTILVLIPWGLFVGGLALVLGVIFG